MHPTVVSKFAGKVVNAVRCGELHTLVAVEGWQLFATGNNLQRHLGFGDVKCGMRQQEVEERCSAMRVAAAALASPCRSCRLKASAASSHPRYATCGCNLSIVRFVCGQVFSAGDASLDEHATCRSFQRMCNESGHSALPDSLFALHAVRFTAFLTCRHRQLFMFSINNMRSSFREKKAMLQRFHAIGGASFDLDGISLAMSRT